MRPLREDLGLNGVRPHVSPHRAILVALATGASLLLLAMSVFSVIGEAKGVSARSAELQATDEALRSSVIVRAQLATAANFAALGVETGVDGEDIVSLSIADARRGLDDLELSLQALSAEGYTVPDSTSLAIDGFREASVLVLAELDNGNGPGARDEATRELVPAFDAVASELSQVRETLADELEESDRQLGRLGNLASFVIAFVVPTIAAFVYQQITRRSGETVAIAHALEEERTLALWRSSLIGRSLSNLESSLSGSKGSPGSLVKAAHGVEATRFVVSATQSGFDYLPSPTMLAKLLATASDGLLIPVSVGGTGWDRAVRLDERSFTIAVRSLLEAAESRGAKEVSVTAQVGDDNLLALRLSDDGRPLDQGAIKRVLNAPLLTEMDQQELGATTLAILVGQMVAEAHDGSIEVKAETGSTSIELLIPTGVPAAIREESARLALAST